MSSSFDERLQAAIAHWHATRSAGEPLSQTDFLERYPDLRTELEAFLAHEIASTLSPDRQSYSAPEATWPERAGAVSDPSLSAHPLADPTDMVSRREMFRVLVRGALNGVFVGASAVLSLAQIPWTVVGRVPVERNMHDVKLTVAVLWLLAVVAVVAGAALAVLVRILRRPSGRIAWEVAWLLAGLAIFAATPSLTPFLWLGLTTSKGLLLLVMLTLALAVGIDGWARVFLHPTRRTAAAGQIPPENARVLEGFVATPTAVVTCLPVLLMVFGVVAGHLFGVAAGRALMPAAFAEAATAFGALVGRVAGALAGAMLTLEVLRLYRVEAGMPWPGQGGRPYPYGLAGLYVAATVVLAGFFWL